MVVIYPLISGDHKPKSIPQIIGLIDILIDIHSQGIVHGDIRASNIIFPFESSNDSSFFIDFDFSGYENIQTYPRGFLVTINDGIRHPAATENSFLKKVHDIYALSGILSNCEVPESSDLWTRVIELLKDGDLLSARDILETMISLKLQVLPKSDICYDTESPIKRIRPSRSTSRSSLSFQDSRLCSSKKSNLLIPLMSLQIRNLEYSYYSF